MTSSERQLQVLGAFVHGWLAAYHALGLAYNARRGNRFDCVVHTFALGYDAWAMVSHLRDAAEDEKGA